MKLKMFIPALLLTCAPLCAAGNAGKPDLPEGSVMENNDKYPGVVSYTLKNGLKLLILEKKFTPTVSFTTIFKVGNVDCVSGKTGLAHLFEHIAFKGTKTINAKNYTLEKQKLDEEEKIEQAILAEKNSVSPDQEKLKALQEEFIAAQKEAEELVEKDEYWKIYNNLGESGMNAFTSADYTGYVVSLPADRLEHWFIIESDRFKNPVLRELYKERSVIMEERRGNEADPNRITWEALNTAAFDAHPYHNPVIGWMDDIERITRTDAEDFHNKFYVPQNATIAIVGDVNPAEVVSYAEKYLGDWEAKPAAPQIYTREPGQKAEKTVNVFFDAQPLIKIGYHNPGMFDSDAPALFMAAEVLSSGKTGRLYKNLVEEKHMALYASAGYASASRYPSLFVIAAAPKAPYTLQDLDKAILDEVEKLKNNPPAQWDLDKILNNYEAELAANMESNEEMSRNLATNEEILGDWKFDWKFLDKLRQVTPQQISDAAKKYLTRANRTAVYLQPENK